MELDLEISNEENICILNHESEKQLSAATPLSERKVHWNCKYVQMLLDCVENRLAEFKNKSIHKKVWDEIGSQMKPYGFSTEHCYNKWKNLRRDVRMFAINPNKVTKNLDTLNRVRTLISTICPNFDPTAVYKKTSKSPKPSPSKMQSEESSSSLEPLAKLLTPPASPFSDLNGDKEPLSSSSEATAESALVKREETLLMASSSVAASSCGLWLPPAAGAVNSVFSLRHSGGQCLHPAAASGHSAASSNTSSSHSSATGTGTGNNYASWPYELHELLLSFRTEEIKQAHSIEQLVRQIGDIRDSSARRIATIEQLMNLASLLISSKLG